MTGPFASLRDEEFVSLTTFRRTGIGVSTAMWFALDGEDVVVSTPAGAGKLKRLRHTPRVTLQACTRRGEPKPGAVVFTGVAHSVQRAEVEAALAAKYGWQWRVALRIEWLISRVRHRRPPPPRAALRITPVEPGRSDAEPAFRRP
ncbi:MAG: PPOX class F420-dependent oxidoreductase [Dermatophilaceae bacterium]